MNVVNKKILFIVTQSEFGGAQRYIFEIVSNLDKQKYEILVAAGEGDGELFKKILNTRHKIENTPTRTVKLKWLKRTPYPLRLIFSISEIFNLLKRERPDILFLCSTTAGLLGSVSGYLYKTLTKHKIQIIYRIGGWSFNDPRPSFVNTLLLWLEKLTAPLKDKIIVNSEFDKEIAIKNRICHPEKLIKIYNGIAPEKLEFLLKEEAKKFLFKDNAKYQIQDTKYLIGCIANFYKTKGLEYLIKAANILNTGFKFQVSDFKILVIGDGKERENLESLIKEYNLNDKVFLMGRIPNAHKYLKAFDMLVLPSLKEGFPWIILEAMASETPIIATKVGAVPEIIKDQKDGMLIEFKNPQELAEKIMKLIQDSGLSQKLKTQAREKLKDFSLQKMVQETEKLF